jgi:hypothetical protein
MGKRIGIVGSRHFPSREVVQLFLKSLPPDDVIVSGGAEGVDSWSVEIGRLLGMKTRVFQADWQRHGRKAGPIRNVEIVSNIDELYYRRVYHIGRCLHEPPTNRRSGQFDRNVCW